MNDYRPFGRADHRSEWTTNTRAWRLPLEARVRELLAAGVAPLEAARTALKAHHRRRAELAGAGASR